MLSFITTVFSALMSAATFIFYACLAASILLLFEVMWFKRYYEEGVDPRGLNKELSTFTFWHRSFMYNKLAFIDCALFASVFFMFAASRIAYILIPLNLVLFALSSVAGVALIKSSKKFLEEAKKDKLRMKESL